jgi:metallopeptidase MepB
VADNDNGMVIGVNIIGLYGVVSTDKALRDASTAAMKLLNRHGIEAAMREDMFWLVDAVLNRAPPL